jgi:hypothetical protein
MIRSLVTRRAPTLAFLLFTTVVALPKLAKACVCYYFGNEMCYGDCCIATTPWDCQCLVRGQPPCS